jgi:hypothetical protein
VWTRSFSNAEREKHLNNIILTFCSDYVMDVQGYAIRPSKHFILGWMRKWDYDILTLRQALASAYKVEKVGKNKFEAYVHAKGKSRKIIFVKDDATKEIFIITGAEGS